MNVAARSSIAEWLTWPNWFFRLDHRYTKSFWQFNFDNSEEKSTDKSKSTGVLYPAAELVIDKQGELQINLIGNPWKLVDVIDWKGTPGVN